jgi:hypothetical protein
MREWLKHLYSDSPDSSYGRVISTCAFLCMIGLHILVMYNPYKLITNTSYVPQFTDKLFYLAIGGYSVTVIKEIAKVVWAKAGIKPVDGDSQ